MKKFLIATLILIAGSTSVFAKDPLPSDMNHLSLQDLHAQCGVYFYAKGNTYKFNQLLTKGKSKYTNFENAWRNAMMEVISQDLPDNQFNRLMEKYYAWSCYYADMS